MHSISVKVSLFAQAASANIVKHARLARTGLRTSLGAIVDFEGRERASYIWASISYCHPFISSIFTIILL